MHLRHCPHCKLLALSGTYCAGCGAHLDGPVVTGVSRRYMALFAIIVFAGVILGFTLGMLGVLQSATDLTFTATPSVTNCSGTVMYAAALSSHDRPLADRTVTIDVDGDSIESLTTDVNGRIASSFPYSIAWCGKPILAHATYRGSVRTRAAVVSAPLEAHLPAIVSVVAPNSIVADVPTPISVTARDGYDGTRLAGALVRFQTIRGEQYTLTDATGTASFSVALPVGLTTLHATLLGDSHYGLVEALPVTIAVAQASLADRVAAIQNGVVSITAGKLLGSAVVLATNAEATVLLTNRHVLENATTETIAARAGNGTIVHAQRFGFAPDDIDLAVIITDKPIGTPVAFEENAPAQGEAVVAIGNPHGLSGSVSRGVVSNLVSMRTTNGALIPVIQTDAAVNPGNSGGGLFDEERGTLLGIISSKEGDAEGIGFAISILTLQSLPSVASWHQ